MVFTNKIMAKKKVDPLLNRISAVDAAARMWYSKRVLTIAQYSDFANFSEIAKHINLTWRGHIKQVSTIPAATVYHMLYVDMGQEW